MEPEDEEIREHLLARKMEEETAARGEADKIAMLQSLDDNVTTSKYKMESVLSNQVVKLSDLSYVPPNQAIQL